jgi:hypothetical protein
MACQGDRRLSFLLQQHKLALADRALQRCRPVDARCKSLWCSLFRFSGSRAVVSSQKLKQFEAAFLEDHHLDRNALSREEVANRANELYIHLFV